MRQEPGRPMKRLERKLFMGKKFGALAEFRHAQVEEPLTPDRLLEVKVPQEPIKAKGRPAGKRSNPDYEPTTVLLRKQTKRKTSRLLEDIESKHDLSDLIESLLSTWIVEHS